MMDVETSEVQECIEGLAKWLDSRGEAPQEICVTLPASWRGERIEARVLDGELVVRLVRARVMYEA